MSVATLPTRLLTAQETADLLNVRLHRIYQLCSQDKIPHVRIGRQIRFRAESLDRWLEAGGQALDPTDEG